MFDWPLLSLLVWIPLAGGALLIALGEKLPDLAVRWP
jgi:NADH-quinone oxidoreductase subunit M